MKQFDIAELRKIGIIQQKQEEYFSMRLRTVGGDLTADQMIKIAKISKDFGDGKLHLTMRQGVEIHNVHFSDLDKAGRELERADIVMGACGPRIRVIVACPGLSTCRWGIIDTKKIAAVLDNKYFRQSTPYKFKIGVTGCPNNCAKANENDIGIGGGLLPVWNSEKCSNCDLCVNVCPPGAIIKLKNEYKLDIKSCFYCSICTSSCPMDSWEVKKTGYSLWIGGTMGKFPRLGTLLKPLIETEEELYGLIDKAIGYYRKNGRTKERFGHLLDRIGQEKAMEEILNG